MAATLVGMRSVDDPPPGIAADPALPSTVAQPLARAREQAAALSRHIRAQAWDEATQAFVAFEAAVAEARAAATAA
jgi:hypothetical protein